MEISVGFFFAQKFVFSVSSITKKRTDFFVLKLEDSTRFFIIMRRSYYCAGCWHFSFISYGCCERKNLRSARKKLLPNIFAKDFFTAFHKAFHPQFCISMIARWLDNLKQNVNENIKHMFHTHPVYLIAFLPKQEKKNLVHMQWVAKKRKMIRTKTNKENETRVKNNGLNA